MTRRSLSTVWLVLTLMTASGCGWFGGSEDESEFGDDFSELTASLGEEGSPEDTPESQVQHTLDVGESFPFIKTVEQTLSQNTPRGPVHNSSKLQLAMVVRVEEIREGDTRFRVRYQDVKYEQEVGGKRLRYQAGMPSTSIPVEVQAYRGLLGNEFSFWLGPDKKLTEMVGFADFLQRCMEGVPFRQRQAALAALSTSSSEEEIAKFLDSSIGLLPNPEDLRVGYVWTTRHEVFRPLPILIRHECEVKELDDRLARIAIRGTVTSTTNLPPFKQFHQDVQVRIRGGHSVGACTIDRITGLPIHSEMQRNVRMTVQLSDGPTFEQESTVVSRIEQASSQTGNSEMIDRSARSPLADGNHRWGGDQIKPADYSTGEASYEPITEASYGSGTR